MFHFTFNKKEFMRQSTNSILMIRPNNFGFNEETANDNHYQNKEFFESNSNENAQKEFDNMVKNLKQNGISVHVFQDDDIITLLTRYFQIIGFRFTKMGILAYIQCMLKIEG